MAYGKIVGGKLELAPKKIKVGSRLIVSPRKKDYIEAGYLPIDPTNDPPEGYEWKDRIDSWEEKDGVKIVKKYTPIPQEELDYETSHALVVMTNDEEQAFQNMTETLENARVEVENAQADAENARTEAENARTEAENARTEAAAAVEAKEAAEAALADTTEIVAKIQEVFG